MKPERVQDLLQRLHYAWRLVDGALERRFEIEGGFGACVDFLDSLYGQLLRIGRYPVATIDGSVVTLRLAGQGGRLRDVDFAIAEVIDQRTAYR